MRLLKEIRNLLGNYHLKSGIYHFYRSEYQPAVDFFTKALRDDPPLCESDRRTATHYLTQTFVHQAERFLENGELDQAVHAYQRASEAMPKYPDIRYRLGQALEKADRPSEAIEEYQAAIEIRPDYVEAYVSLGFLQLKTGQFEASTETFRKALDLRMARLEVPFKLGQAQMEAGEGGLALAYFREVFFGDPRQFDTLFRSAMNHLKHENFEKSLQALESAREIHPRFPDLPNYIGLALAELGRLEEAAQMFREATKLSPHYDVPRLNLAFTLIRLGDYRDAEKELEQVLVLDPEQPAALAKLEELRQGVNPDRRRGQSRGASA